jgi:neutral ceramidase
VLIRLPVRFLRINDTVVWAAPVELLCEIAIAVRNRSPFPRTFYFGYTNGWFGYLPTAQAFEEGGYELRTSPFSPRAEGDVTDGVPAGAGAVRLVVQTIPSGREIISSWRLFPAVL